MAKRGPKVSAEMKEAERLVRFEGKTAYAAAQLAGVSRSAISKSAWYQAFIKERKQAPPVR